MTSVKSVIFSLRIDGVYKTLVGNDAIFRTEGGREMMGAGKGGRGGVIELPNQNHVIRLVHSHDSTVTRPRLNR